MDERKTKIASVRNETREKKDSKFGEIKALIVRGLSFLRRSFRYNRSEMSFCKFSSSVLPDATATVESAKCAPRVLFHFIRILSITDTRR